MSTDGYRSVENALYDVEVHRSGPASTSFKWSRTTVALVGIVAFLVFFLAHKHKKKHKHY